MLEKRLKLTSIIIIVCCCVLLLPQIQFFVKNFIIEIAEKIIRRSLNHDYWLVKIQMNPIFVIFCFVCILICSIESVFVFLKKHGEKILKYISVGIVTLTIIVRIIMYIKCRSLWIDEAMLASSIVFRNWLELLTPPLDYDQSAPVLYIIAVKAICSIFGYSETSLRILSLFSFIGLLICEILLLKKVFNYKSYQINLVVIITALLPSYIWYSNELKPYMGDAFFAILIILLYFYYTNGKIKLLPLIVFYIIFLAFSTPAIFFIGGVLFFEFLTAIFNKNKKYSFLIFLMGISILVVFGLYYYLWLSSVSEVMNEFWNDSFNILRSIRKIQEIFNPFSHSDSSFLLFFVPFALLGLFSLCKLKNKFACSTMLSLFFVFLASAMGKWPLTGRLWLFLPVIVLIFTPIGIDFIHDIIKRKKITSKIEIGIFSAVIIYLTIGCLGYTGNKMYFYTEEVNPLIYYVQKNIKEDEKLYIYPSAIPVFNFKNDYNTLKIEGVAHDNIIYGRNRNEWNESLLGNELQLILENEKTYLIFQHLWISSVKIDNGLDVLRNYGTLTEVMNVYDTPLYYFEKHVNNE